MAAATKKFAADNSMTAAGQARALETSNFKLETPHLLRSLRALRANLRFQLAIYELGA
jgi:hypothetical protein